MDYTEQEIEMLARFTCESRYGTKGPWSSAPAAMRAYVIEDTLAYLHGSTEHGEHVRAAARLMREAREQGAAEMREMAAIRVFDDFNALESFDRDTATDLRESVRRLPLTVPQ